MVRVALLIVVCASIASCSAPHVNVPPLPGDVAFHSPNRPVVLRAESLALEHVMRRWPPEGPYKVRLPEGTSIESAHIVIEPLPPTTTDASGDALVYSVEQVQIRSGFGRVDLVKPATGGRDQLVSVFLGIDLEGWYVRHSRLWNVSVDEALRILRSSPAEAEAEQPPSGGD